METTRKQIKLSVSGPYQLCIDGEGAAWKSVVKWRELDRTDEKEKKGM